PLVFERNDLPGVMLASAALRLVHLYGVRPGSTAVVATGDDDGYYAALDLLEAGVRIAVLVDSRPEFPHGMEAAEALKSEGVVILPAHTVVVAEGNQRVVEAIVARVVDGRPTAEERRFDCDVICMSGSAQPAASLLQMAGARMRYDDLLGEMAPRELPPDIYVAGDVTGIHDLAASVLQGRLAGARAARGGSSNDGRLDSQLDAIEGRKRANAVTSSLVPPAAGHRRFVCLCEDVTESDIVQAIDEGFDDIQILKRYSTVTMGPCQGKMCHKAFVDAAARRTGRSVQETGATTARPPVRPVPLGALAGPSHMPIKRTPLHRKHEELGASIVDLGPWRRPYSYTSPQEECLAVRERVGIIDVSTLGKLDVRGRDAPALLDRVYTHRFSDLRTGRIRYGILCADNGTIMDDGTVSRLADDRYFVTTTTGNIELIEEWFKWWSAGTGMCVHFTNLTSAYAAINVAGPRARETLAKLTDLDLSSEGFRYMRLRQAEVAGVPTLLLKIGFVGETGWELHFPSEYGEYMWDALTDAGEEFGIAPFGLEAQRILRLEKKHIIVGQDTDAASNPLESDMGWVVKFDKQDFIGRGGLLGVQERGLQNKLVGFAMGDDTVPEDGDPIMVGRRPVGRVTSSRLSPTRGEGFGLAWVPVDMSEDGSEIHIRMDGRNVPARVTLKAFYDPKGKRLRE
ncbi:MAG: (2Fe-2S)-binding protein, partial [Chloroflexi bacterium]|nr:(2Fe-2S)-binding protein [Chloroflexota bacterium]